MSLTKKIALAFVVIWFFVGGLGHFLSTEFFVSIVPPWVPWPYAAVYLSGVFELLGVIGILITRYRAIAGLGLILLTIAVTPANIYMWLNPQLFPDIPHSLLAFRLVLQVLLIACIWWSTRKNSA